MININKIKLSILLIILIYLCSIQCYANTHRHISPVTHSIKHTKHSPHAKHKKKHIAHKHITLSSKSTAVNNMQEETPRQFTSAVKSGMFKLGERMVQFVHSTIATLRYTAYKLGGTHFDRSHGIYIIDCSDYVDHLLQVSNPAAYLSLVNSSGSDKPTSEHYYHFFSNLTYKPKHYWNKIDNVKELQPGDILVFRNQKNSRTGVSGHVMVVMNKPTRIQDAFAIRVTDSASSGHSQDTRSPHTSGIGIGTMQIKVNPSGEPSAYAWKLGSAFEHHVNFAMARPVGG